MKSFKKCHFLVFITISLLIASCTTPPPIINTFVSNKYNVKKGEEVLLNWNVQGAKSVSIKGIDDNLPIVGSQKVTLIETTTFILKANYDNANEVAKSLIVTVELVATTAPLYPPILICALNVCAASVVKSATGVI